MKPRVIRVTRLNRVKRGKAELSLERMDPVRMGLRVGETNVSRRVPRWSTVEAMRIRRVAVMRVEGAACRCRTWVTG